MKNVILALLIGCAATVFAASPEAAEKAALQSPAFIAAREQFKQSAHDPEYLSRTVVKYGGMKTYNPTTTYLVIERWYSFDTYTNLIAEVSFSALPPGSAPSVKLMRLVPATPANR